MWHSSIALLPLKSTLSAQHTQGEYTTRVKDAIHEMKMIIILTHKSVLLLIANQNSSSDPMTNESARIIKYTSYQSSLLNFHAFTEPMNSILIVINLPCLYPTVQATHSLTSWILPAANVCKYKLHFTVYFCYFVYFLLSSGWCWPEQAGTWIRRNARNSTF